MVDKKQTRRRKVNKNRDKVTLDQCKNYKFQVHWKNWNILFQ